MPMHNLRAIALPYCLDRQPDGRYVVLNRNYKPLGFAVTDFVTYADHPIAVRLPGLTPAVAARLAWNRSPALDKIFLYNDETIPDRSREAWAAYSARLEVLASLSVGLD